MDVKISVNAAEKQRQRDRIDEQLRRYLENGGSITVVETPVPERLPKGSTWQVQADAASLTE